MLWPFHVVVTPNQKVILLLRHHYNIHCDLAKRLLDLQKDWAQQVENSALELTVSGAFSLFSHSLPPHSSIYKLNLF